jgi:pyruvate formate lyase activating enzyme
MRKEAALYRKLDGERVECIACARRCKIPEGSRGFCSVRSNTKGKLYLDNYGRLIAMHLDPIEKKPFYHFMPGTGSFSVGTSSCNFGCLFCQNHEMSKEKEIMGEEVSPEKVVELALRSGAKSIAYTYNEPTIFIEYALDTARLAHDAGLKNVFVTNGYMTLETVKAMKGLVDAAVVNFKGNGDQKFVNKYQAIPSIDPIKESMLAMKKAGIHLEMTDMPVPGAGDSLDACGSLMDWVIDNMGNEVPLHFIAFYPDYKMLDYPATSYGSLKEHYDVAKVKGMKYVYLGNLPGNPYESTYCPVCGSLVISRTGSGADMEGLSEDMKCVNCGNQIPIV